MGTTNPFHDPLRFQRQVKPCSLVIFGANGDLTKRKLIPALYRLAFERRLPSGFSIIGNSRTEMSDDAYRDKMRQSVIQFLEESPFDESVWRDFAAGLFYISGDLRDPNLYSRLAAKLADLDQTRLTASNALFYLSTQPSHYEPVIEGLGAAGLHSAAPTATNPNPWRRLVVEKPFGHDLASSRQLDTAVHRVFAEDAVYRIDHYLGKETVQNILAFRFGNGIFEPLWDRRYVNHVQITAAESIGVEGRGGYYEEAGALRDMIQNHLLQILATVAMEPPALFEATAVRDERAKLLRSIRILKHDEVPTHAVKGQYGPADVGGSPLAGFRQEQGVSPNSQTDTYAAVTFFIDNWRWAGVPFYVRSGKRLAKRVTDIAISFNPAPHRVFAASAPGAGPADLSPNLLILRVQPEEGISLRFLSKQPGDGMQLRPVSMDFKYGSSFGMRSPTAYETLLVDALTGDATLYSRQDMVEASWQAVHPILEVWNNTTFDFPNYPSGSWGPASSDDMLARRGHTWRVP